MLSFVFLRAPAGSARIEARSRELAAEADLRKAQEAAGDDGDSNAQLRSARAAIEKAELEVKDVVKGFEDDKKN